MVGKPTGYYSKNYREFYDFLKNPVSLCLNQPTEWQLRFALLSLINKISI